MEFKGKIHIRELEKKQVDLSAQASDAWIQKMLTSAAPDPHITGLEPADWANKISDFSVNLQVQKIAGEYLVTGDLKGKVPTGCSRCGDPFFASREASFKVVLVRSEKSRSMSDDELDSGDPDFVYFFGDEIDLIVLLREQLIVLEPVAECPPKDEKTSSCLLCGKNPSGEFSFGSKSQAQNGGEKAEIFAGQGFENSAFSALSKLLKSRK